MHNLDRELVQQPYQPRERVLLEKRVHGLAQRQVRKKGSGAEIRGEAQRVCMILVAVCVCCARKGGGTPKRSAPGRTPVAYGTVRSWAEPLHGVYSMVAGLLREV